MKKATSGSPIKVTFGRRRKGESRKTNGPKTGNVKKYKGQGR